MTALTDAFVITLATSTTGFAAVIGDILNINTAAPSRNEAALLAIYAMGMQPRTGCGDPTCNCGLRALELIAPEVRIVPIKIEVGHG